MPTAGWDDLYTFANWYTQPNGGGTQFTASTVITSSITVYAKWQCTVTYVANGASGTPPASQTVNAGSSVTLPTPSGLSWTDHTFSGWNTNAEGTGDSYNAYVTYTPAGNVTLYAQWTVAQCIVTFNAGSGRFNEEEAPHTTETRTVDKGSSVGSANMPPEPTRPGHTFAGWFELNGAELSIPFDEDAAVDHSKTVYAKWTIDSYIVTFHLYDESMSFIMPRDHGESFGTTLPIDTSGLSEGKTFQGWYTAPNGGGSQLSETTTITEDMEVWAYWI
jgi:uncharacterized repeat protein (TIGR02543 family)